MVEKVQKGRNVVVRRKMDGIGMDVEVCRDRADGFFC